MDFVEIIKSLMDFILHVDEHLFVMIQEYGLWVYILLFIVIFVETGLVVMPFLPGDSLLFAAGAFCAGVVNDAGVTAKLSLPIIIVSLIIAAVIGDTVNYSVGKNLGLKILNWKIKGYQLVKKEYIDQTQTFYAKHGPRTIIIARFVPIVRTFAPFVAGIGQMAYPLFIRFNIVGGMLWVIGLTLLGYFFGNIPIVKDNFETVIFAIIGISLLPIIYEFIKHKTNKSKQIE
ncbi:MAG: DedA family protein [Saprospiraceae bacterium]|nr:DedA family protein [Saprospiraceae bacterium]MBK9742811.1 DedA family protein [Saprospiraceae bacterium]MBP8212724.1 DedA family protein [Saprospiraceae bacterium]